jgi:hypothetical protein
MLVNTYAVLNYNRCRRFAALNDPYQQLHINDDSFKENLLFHDIFLSHLYRKDIEIKKHINLTYEFDYEITLSENYDFIVDDKVAYELLPVTSTDLLKLKFKQGDHKYQLFTKTADGTYKLRETSLTNKNFQDKLEKLYAYSEPLGRIIFSYAFKKYILRKVYPDQNIKLIFVLLNKDFKYDGIAYSDKLYHMFDFSDLRNLDELVEIAMFRMINHIELNDFTPCKLVKKACQRGKGNECKFVSFCYSHLPENTSILDYFNSHLFFQENTPEGAVHHDSYDLLNEGYVSMQDIPISWLNDQNHLMQRYCVDNQTIYYNRDKLTRGLEELKYPIYYLDFEAYPEPIPKKVNESPYTQSVFQYSVHIQHNKEESLDIKENHHGFIANPNRDERELLIKKMIEVLGDSDSSIVVYNKTFEKGRLEEMQVSFPKYKKELSRIINRLFDLLDVVKMNKNFYSQLGFKKEELESYNLYHPDLGGSYSLKKVIKLFAPEAYEGLDIKDGISAYKAYEKMADSSAIDAENIRKNLFLYCRQDTYSMYQIIDGINKILSGEF